jgi:hypothetical protein
MPPTARGGIVATDSTFPARRRNHMIWLALAVVVYAVMGLYLIALCRVASTADGEVRRVANDERAPRAA